MTKYLDHTFEDNENFIQTFDELPLWSASFGLLLFKHLELRPSLTVADIGSGAGFPLLELAERLGNSCKVYGVDPWKTANDRCKQKIKNYNITNVELIESPAEMLPFKDQSIDLIVSNLGINNFSDPAIVFKECKRVLKANGKLALTTNTFGHWKEFYEIFYSTLRSLKKENLIEALKKDEEHRGTFESTSKLFTDNGFKVCRHFTDSFEMRFADGTAFLNHHFIKLGWLTSWIQLFPKEELQEIFSALENDLNLHSKKQGGLTLTVPMLYIEGEK